MIDVVLAAALLLAVSASFFVSASAGLGGSLVLVPTLALVLGTKEGVALAALLLACNNVVKVAAYRQTLPIRSSAIMVLGIGAGAIFGARLLVAAPEALVTIAVILSFGIALVAQRRDMPMRDTALAPGLAFSSGATSGFSGTSGPLKGVAIRSLKLDRLHMVGAASLASLVGDAAKTAVFAEAQLLTARSWQTVGVAVPLMFLATFAGRHFTNLIGERGYDRLFWGVMGGYTLRLLFEI